MFSRTRIGAVVAAVVIVDTTAGAVRALQAQQPAPARATAAAGTPRSLSLDEAMRIAERASEALQIAGAGVERARGQQLQARSQYMPQLNGSLQYTRTLKSQFEVARLSGGAIAIAALVIVVVIVVPPCVLSCL